MLPGNSASACRTCEEQSGLRGAPSEPAATIGAANFLALPCAASPRKTDLMTCLERRAVRADVQISWRAANSHIVAPVFLRRHAAQDCANARPRPPFPAKRRRVLLCNTLELQCSLCAGPSWIGAGMARQRQTTASKLRLVTETTDEAVARIAGTHKPDPRLADLVRQLARQAARDFVQQETARLAGDRLPD